MSLVVEALRSGISMPVGSTVTALIVGGACAAILSTTGQTVQAETEVLARIDAAGTRSVVISDTQGRAGITTDAVDRIGRVSGVEWVIGLGPAKDVRAAGNPGGPPAPIRTLYGPLPPQIRTDGLNLGSGLARTGPEAQTTLGLQQPIGGVTSGDEDYAVVGSFTAEDPLLFLNRSLITLPTGGETILRSIHILADTPEQVAQVADAALILLGPEDPTSVAVETSETLAQVRAAVQGELGRFSRRLITLVLAAGLVLVGLNVYGTITSRRRDLGRRRALGASRPTIVTLITTQTTLTAITGAITGTLVTAAILTRITGTPPEPRFSIAIIILTTLTATLAAIPPAIVAAYRDPVRVLRVP